MGRGRPAPDGVIGVGGTVAEAAAAGAPGDDAEVGQGIVEYGLILTLSAALAIAILVFLGGPLADVIDFMARAIDEAT